MEKQILNTEDFWDFTHVSQHTNKDDDTQKLSQSQLNTPQAPDKGWMTQKTGTTPKLNKKKLQQNYRLGTVNSKTVGDVEG